MRPFLRFPVAAALPVPAAAPVVEISSDHGASDEDMDAVPRVLLAELDAEQLLAHLLRDISELGDIGKRAREAACFAKSPGWPLSIGSACSGLGSEIFALKRIGVEWRTRFLVENDRKCEAFLKKTHDHELYFHDVTSHDFFERAPACDLFTAGWPCQPWSSGGRNRGCQDARGTIIYYLLRYMLLHGPLMAPS